MTLISFLQLITLLPVIYAMIILHVIYCTDNTDNNTTDNTTDNTTL